jgi:hypothetical protein
MLAYVLRRIDLGSCHFAPEIESVRKEIRLLNYVNLGLFHVMFWFANVLLLIVIHDSQASFCNFSVVIGGLNTVAFGALVI